MVGAEDPTLVPIGLLSWLLAEDPSGLFGDSAAITEGFMAVASPGADGGTGSVRIYRIYRQQGCRVQDRMTAPREVRGFGLWSHPR